MSVQIRSLLRPFWSVDVLIDLDEFEGIDPAPLDMNVRRLDVVVPRRERRNAVGEEDDHGVVTGGGNLAGCADHEPLPWCSRKYARTA